MSGTDQKSSAATSTARRTIHPGLVLLIIAGAQVMVVLDATIVNIALPSMGEYFGKNQTDMTWALNAYTLAFGTGLLLGGRSGDLLGRRKMFIIGLGLFSLGSLLGGLSFHFGFLLFGRVIQGFGGAIASPTALSLITTSFEEGEERNRAISVYAAVSGAGAAVGLLLGGILTEYLTWRWVLFVNVPIGILLMIGAFLYLHESERLKGKFDFIGAVASALGMFMLVYGFIHVAHDGWANTETYLLFGAAAVLLIGFVYFEAKVAKEPMMPMRIFANRSRSGAYIVMLVVGAAMFGLFYFVTYFIQQVLGYSALKAGFAFLPVAITIGITAQIAGKALPKAGPKALITGGTALLVVAMLLLSTVTAESTYLGKLLPGMIILAIAMGLIFVPITSVAVSNVRNTDAGLASALLNVGQQVGGAIGLSVLATVAATTGKNYANDHIADAGKAVATLPTEMQQPVQGFLASSGGKAPQPDQIQAFIHSQPATDQATLQHFFGPDGALQSMFTAHVQAHASSMGFLTAAIFAIVALVVAATVINVKKEDLPTGSDEGAPVIV
ncbi:drug resistance transporter, EmrB/QacA subfamily [Frankineae bacterium MT45]|nr:drug resistance transporter, EmrB/QacA subfamily [Frankineae bacterium MT45]